MKKPSTAPAPELHLGADSRRSTSHHFDAAHSTKPQRAHLPDNSLGPGDERPSNFLDVAHGIDQLRDRGCVIPISVPEGWDAPDLAAALLQHNAEQAGDSDIAGFISSSADAVDRVKKRLDPRLPLKPQCRIAFGTTEEIQRPDARCRNLDLVIVDIPPLGRERALARIRSRWKPTVLIEIVEPRPRINIETRRKVYEVTAGEITQEVDTETGKANACIVLLVVGEDGELREVRFQGPLDRPVTPATSRCLSALTGKVIRNPAALLDPAIRERFESRCRTAYAVELDLTNPEAPMPVRLIDDWRAN